MNPARRAFFPPWQMAHRLLILSWAAAILLAPDTRGAVPANPDNAAAAAKLRAARFERGWGTYSGAPRLRDGHVDRERLLRELAEQHARAYSWLIWRGDHDWDDLQAFLPEANKRGLRVWVTLVPPSESPPRNRNYSEPFRLDYERWAIEIARLSLREPALVGWSIDDFVWNAKELPPERMRSVVAGARAINPSLAFFPCCYFSRTTPAFLRDYGDVIDGIFFPYRSESTKVNLSDATHVAEEVAVLRQRLGPDKSVVLMVYTSAHSRLGATTNDYVATVMNAGRQTADGVIVFVHQDPAKEPLKYATITRLFSRWADQP